jgi:hypothetical protein
MRFQNRVEPSACLVVDADVVSSRVTTNAEWVCAPVSWHCELLSRALIVEM